MTDSAQKRMTAIAPEIEMICNELDSVKERLQSGSCHMSHEQIIATMELAHVITSPAIQTLYINDLCRRWKVTDRTIRNWITQGIVQKGHTRAHDTRAFWYADEIDRMERELKDLGYLRKKPNPLVQIAHAAFKYLRR